MFLDLQTLVTVRIPEILQEASSQGGTSPLSPLRVLSMVNSAYGELTNKGQHVMHPDTVDYLNLEVANSDTGELSGRIPRRAHKVICLTPRTDDVPRRAERLAVIQRAWEGPVIVNFGESMTYRRAPMGQLFIQEPRPSGNKYRLWFLRNFPMLHYGAVAAGQTSSTTTLHMRTSPDVGYWDPTPGVYEHTLVYIRETMETAIVTECNRITGVATVVSAEDGESPLSQAITAGMTYCTMPWFQNHHELLAIMAARKFTKMDAASALGEAETRHLATFLDWVTPEDSVSPKRPVNLFNSDLGMNLGAIGGGLDIAP